MRGWRSSGEALLIALSVQLATALGPVVLYGEQPIGFNRDIRPLLSDRCFVCHGPGTQEAGLRLDSFVAATESAIVPGDIEASEVIARITSDDPDMRMPPPDSQKKPLTPAQVEVFKQWVAEGAKYQKHWAYLPLERSAVPEVQNKKWSRGAVDRFVLARLEAEKLAPAPEADRVTLLRRVTLDLTGLPPTTAEVDAFLKDERPDAYEQVVERLLASPRHAERLATWWFDLVRFADTVGYHGDQDHHILPYRDYVLKSFAENKPFDQFTIEQLAGDLLPNPDLWQQVATGYNRMLQTSHEGGIQDGEYRAKMQADRVRNVSEVWLGASMGCAECHNHKYDPITQADFYSMGAFFADVDHYGSFAPVSENVSPTHRPPEILAWTLPQADEIGKIDAKIAALEETLSGKLPKEFAKSQAKVAQLKKRRADIEARFVPTMVTQAVAPREIRILPRGDWLDNSGAVVQPRWPAELGPVELGGKPAASGRNNRLDLAKWITARDNPLTPRVVTNRLWKMCFGVGLSKTLLDIGSQGEPPSHPELLDHLAAELVDNGWDLRRLLRTLVTSSAYRQSSAPRAELIQRDPENRLLARQGRYRLEAEAVRDSALAHAGLLVQQFGGEFAYPYQPAGYYGPLNYPPREYAASTDANQYRRGVYTHWQRQFLHPWLLAFDAPSREECTANRPISNTPTAALVLLNDPSFVEAARGLATRTLTTNKTDDKDRLAWAWREVTSRTAKPEELTEMRTLLAAQRKRYEHDTTAAEQLISIGQSKAPDDVSPAELASWTAVSRAILNTHEFLSRN